jgi:hypothetical protein
MTAMLIPLDRRDGRVGPLGENGIAFDARGDFFVANRDGFDLLKIDPLGNAVVFEFAT